MRLIIEAREFATLSHDTQQELLDRFAGEYWARKAGSKKPPAQEANLVDLTPGHAAQLVEELSQEDRRLLQLFAQRGGRVKLNELLAAKNDSDPETVSRFVAAITGKVQAMLDEKLKGKGVFAQEQVTGEETTMYRMSELTAQSLRCFFPIL